MKQHICSTCGKYLANRHSLSRHKKLNCPITNQAISSQGKAGKGMHMPIPSRIVTPSTKDLTSRIRSKEKFKELYKKLNEEEDHPLTLAADRAIKEVNRMEHDGELSVSTPSFQDCSSSDDEPEDDDDDCLWEKFALKVNNDRTIFECLATYLHVYYNLGNDYVYQKIIGDVDDTASSFASALDNAIDRNLDFIVRSVEKCRQKDDEDEILNIFGGMARARNDHDGCQWFSGARCYCRECEGKSLFTTFRTLR